MDILTDSEGALGADFKSEISYSLQALVCMQFEVNEIGLMWTCVNYL